MRPALVLAAACTTKARPPQTLVIGVPSDPGQVEPIVSRNTLSTQVAQLTREPLVDGTFDCRLTWEPRLATFEIDEDGSAVTYQLDTSYRWEDGRRVSPEDVVMAWSMIREPAALSPRFALGQQLPRSVVTEDGGVRFEAARPLTTDQLLGYTSPWLLPAHDLEGLSLDARVDHLLTKPPKALGPWRVTDHVPDTSLTLGPNPHYRGPKARRPHVDAVRFHVIPAYANRLDSLLAGNLDMMDGIDIRDVPRVRALRPDLTLHRRGYRFMDFVAWNLQDPRLSNPRIRQALAYAVDVDALITANLTTPDGTRYGTPAVSTVTPELCDLQPDLRPLPHDADQARALLDAAGWIDTDDDGIREKGDLELSFQLLTNIENPRRRAAAARIADQFARVGVHVDVAEVPFNEMLHRIETRRFHAVLSGWSAGLFVDLRPMWHQDGAFNYPGYANHQVNGMIEYLEEETMDPEERADVIRAVQRQVYADQPYLFLYWRDEVTAVSPRVKGARPDILSPFEGLHEWRIEEP